MARYHIPKCIKCQAYIYCDEFQQSLLGCVYCKAKQLITAEAYLT
jgi:acetyl-CoA carboxylase beta subunit